MNGLGRFFARGFSEAEDLACIFVVPVPVVLDPTPLLGLQILPVSLSYGVGTQPLDVLLWWSMNRGILRLLLSPA
jgi:hypothetical protein